MCYAAGQARIPFIIMCNIQLLSNAAMRSSHGTPASENGTQLFNSNVLRSYNAEGKRRRKPSSSSAMRQQFIISLTGMYPDIRKIKVHDTGIFFSARVWMYGGRIVHKQAYSLQNLYGLLDEGIRMLYA